MACFWLWRSAVAAWCLLLCPSVAAAAEVTPSEASTPGVSSATKTRDEPAGAWPRRGCEPLCYVHSFADVGWGKGLRLNNPLRLRTQLGDAPESLSATASTLDFKLAALLGDPFGAHHGFGVAAAVALEGVPQQVIVPAYQFALPIGHYVWWRAHLGPAIVTQPDVNVGVELGTQFVGLLRSGIGPYVGLVYSQFWGAGTDQTQAVAIPVIAGQAGITVVYEVLP